MALEHFFSFLSLHLQARMSTQMKGRPVCKSIALPKSAYLSPCGFPINNTSGLPHMHCANAVQNLTFAIIALTLVQ